MTIDYDAMVDAYARHRRVHPEVLRDLIESGKLAGGGASVLEVGCGTGNYILTLQSLVACQAWGVDPSQGMLAQAAPWSETLYLVKGHAESLGFAPASFDLVFSVDVIHHVAHHQAYFNEAYWLLKPGGRLCTVTDSAEMIRRREPFATYFPETVPLELARYPRIATLRASMTQTGFGEIVEHKVEFRYEIPNIEVYRDKAFSMLHLLPEDAFQRGIARMEADLQKGPVQCISRYLLLWGRKG